MRVGFGVLVGESFAILGMAALDPAYPEAPQLSRDADRALYHAKDTGRHGIAAASPTGTLRRLAG